MKNNVTKFDLTEAFKALDEIDIPKVSGLKPNRPNMCEAVQRVDRLSMLIEDYYNVNEKNEMEQARDDRADDVAKAKLDRIERIVDLDADTPDEILPSYVGKEIIQCPNCLNLFYKDPEDVEKSEDNDRLVNIGEVCQHCGNDSGYNLIGKVAEDEPAESTEEESSALDSEAQAEETEPQENNEQAADDIELPELDLEGEENGDEDNKKEESLNTEANESLNEDVDKELDKKLEEHDSYIKYLQDQIELENQNLKEANNEFIRLAIERRIDSLNSDLEAALPSEVKDAIDGTNEENDAAALDEFENNDDDAQSAEDTAENALPENLVESVNISEDIVSDLEEFARGLTEDSKLEEDAEEVDAKLAEFEKSLPEGCDKLKEDKVSDSEFASMLHDPLYYEGLNEDANLDSATSNVIKKIDAIDDKYADEEEEQIDRDYHDYSEDELRRMGAFDNLNDDEDFDEITDESLNSHISNMLTELYYNVDHFEATNCEMPNNKLIVEGNIHFKSGNANPTKFEFEKVDNKFVGLNEDLCSDKAFTMEYTINDKVLVVENINYKLNINNKLVEGYTKK